MTDHLQRQARTSDSEVTSADRGPAEPQLAMLGDFLKRNGPKGVTPLANRLGDIRQRIERRRGTKRGCARGVLGREIY